MNLGNNIKTLRKERGLTQERMSDILNESFPGTVNFNKGKISKWENGKETPYLSSAKILADFFETTVDDLINNDFSNSIYTIYNQLEKPRQEKVYSFAEQQLEEQNQTQTVVTLGKTAAGEPIEQGDIIEEEKEVSNVPSDAEVALVVQGDSMEPDYKNGSVVFYKKQPQVENGELAVVHIKDDGITFKKLLYDYDNKRIILRSLNDKYEDKVFEENEITVLGKVIN